MIAKPFVKWAGGKGAYAKTVSAVLPKEMDIFYEPFVGGGAVFFHLAEQGGRFRHAVLSDSCKDLIQTYTAIRDHVSDVVGRLRCYAEQYRQIVQRSMRHAEEFYLSCRSARPNKLSPEERAARFIFLNKTCFNGLYRVNQDGEFNVSFGKNSNPKIYTELELEKAAWALQRAELYTMDFADALDLAEEGDAAYLDPPYFQKKKNSFVSYSPEKFTRHDHARLCRTFESLAGRGVAVAETNADAPAIRKAYAEYRIINANMRRSISATPMGRIRTNDLLILANCRVHHGTA